MPENFRHFAKSLITQFACNIYIGKTVGKTIRLKTKSDKCYANTENNTNVTVRKFAVGTYFVNFHLEISDTVNFV